MHEIHLQLSGSRQNGKTRSEQKRNDIELQENLLEFLTFQSNDYLSTTKMQNNNCMHNTWLIMLDLYHHGSNSEGKEETLDMGINITKAAVHTICLPENVADKNNCKFFFAQLACFRVVPPILLYWQIYFCEFAACPTCQTPFSTRAKNKTGNLLRQREEKVQKTLDSC